MKLKSFRIRNTSQIALDEFDTEVNEWLEKQKTPITIEHVSSIPEGDNTYATLLIFYSTRKDKLEKINDQQS